MDILDEKLKVLSLSIDSIIRREVGCLTDELVRAERVFYLIDNDLKKFCNSFLDLCQGQDIKQYLKNDSVNISSKDVLLVIVHKNFVPELKKYAQYFKDHKGRVVIITDNRTTEQNLLSNELIGISIPASAEKIDEYEGNSKLIFQQTIIILLDTISSQLKKRYISA